MPSYGEAAQIITALAALGAFLLSWRNGRKIEQVHTSTNGKMDQLLKVTRSDATKDGVKEGRELQKSEAQKGAP